MAWERNISRRELAIKYIFTVEILIRELCSSLGGYTFSVATPTPIHHPTLSPNSPGQPLALATITVMVPEPQ